VASSDGISYYETPNINGFFIARTDGHTDTIFLNDLPCTLFFGIPPAIESSSQATVPGYTPEQLNHILTGLHQDLMLQKQEGSKESYLEWTKRRSDNAIDDMLAAQRDTMEMSLRTEGGMQIEDIEDARESNNAPSVGNESERDDGRSIDIEEEEERSEDEFKPDEEEEEDGSLESDIEEEL